MEMPADDRFNLERFVNAQDPVYTSVCAELRAGQKVGHWMWFVFPQLRGLGHSWMASRFGIASLEEARAYLQHPLLGPRLRECTRLVNQVENRTADDIFGYPDDLKFRSSMTLFARAAEEGGEFEAALAKYFGAEGDPLTLAQAGVSGNGCEDMLSNEQD